MPAFCAGYFSGDLLFDIYGLQGSPAPVVGYVANTFSTLTRGAPTRPSPLLKQLLNIKESAGNGAWETLIQEPLHLVDQNAVDWRDRIKGGEDGYRPALEFFEVILPEQLPKWAFVQQLIVAEYSLFRSLGAPRTLTEDSINEDVDFYLPQADLVIEIDGSGHDIPSQQAKDRERDRFLERFGILTLRLKTQDLRRKTKAFHDFFAALKKRCETSPRLQPYQQFLSQRKFASPSIRFELTAIIRLQITLMIAISHRQLDPEAHEWRLNIRHDFVAMEGQHWPEIALRELFDWFSLFARLDRDSFSPPEIVFAEDGLLIDMRLFARPDDRHPPSGMLMVRTHPVQDLPFILGGHITRVQDLGISYIAAQNREREQPLPKIEDLRELCRRVFGHENFLPGQEALILNAVSGQKSLGLMPTGGGKSLCFQLPALLGSGTTVTVVPIKALGRDHCAELEAAGFKGRVVNIDSDMPPLLRDQVYGSLISRSAMRFVFVSPERFQIEGFRQIMGRLLELRQLRMFVIDEVHCMSEWGHDFRPSYLTLPGTLQELAREVPVLGLTATASVNVLRDIQGEFDIPDEMVAYEMHRSRTELNFSVRQGLSAPHLVVNEVTKIVEAAQSNLPPPTHIFARYANGMLGVEAYASLLGRSPLGLRVGYFSGREPTNFEAIAAIQLARNENIPLPKSYNEYKQTVQALWKSSDLDVIVTTKAFGMGVNKPNVRHTLHAGMPSSMEAFYQEAGRAGRDRDPAHCHMLIRKEPDDAGVIFARLQKDLTPAAIQKVLDEKSDGNRLKKNEGGDFRAQLWFLHQGLISREEEEALVARLHDLLRARMTAEGMVPLYAEDIKDLRHGAERLQQTLYRLYQLGLVAPWTVTDWGRTSGEDSHVAAVLVRDLGTSFAQACAMVEKRILAIEGRAAVVEELDQLRLLQTGDEDWPQLYRVLLSWVRRKHLDNRLQSTWNLYRKSIDFQADQAEAFREELEAFFKVDSNAFQLAGLRDIASDLVVPVIDSLISASNGDEIKDRGALRKLLSQLARLLEGTQDSPGLNLAAASLLLLTEDRPSHEASLRFQAAIPEGAAVFWQKPEGRRLLTRLASANPGAKTLIGEWIVKSKPTRETLLQVHDAFAVPSVEAELFKEISADLAEIW